MQCGGARCKNNVLSADNSDFPAADSVRGQPSFSILFQIDPVLCAADITLPGPNSPLHSPREGRAEPGVSKAGEERYRYTAEKMHPENRCADKIIQRIK